MYGVFKRKECSLFLSYINAKSEMSKRNTGIGILLPFIGSGNKLVSQMFLVNLYINCITLQNNKGDNIQSPGRRKTYKLVLVFISQLLN